MRRTEILRRCNLSGRLITKQSCSGGISRPAGAFAGFGIEFELIMRLNCWVGDDMQARRGLLFTGFGNHSNDCFIGCRSCGCRSAGRLEVVTSAGV